VPKNYSSLEAGLIDLNDLKLEARPEKKAPQQL
jgi:hypothetical protein